MFVEFARGRGRWRSCPPRTSYPPAGTPSARKRSTSRPTATTARTCSGGSSARVTAAKVSPALSPQPLPTPTLSYHAVPQGGSTDQPTITYVHPYLHLISHRQHFVSPIQTFFWRIQISRAPVHERCFHRSDTHTYTTRSITRFSTERFSEEKILFKPRHNRSCSPQNLSTNRGQKTW